MQLAAVHALEELAKQSVPAVVLEAAHQTALKFGPDYILPKLVDPRLCEKVSSAVSKAAISSGVAALPFPDKESFI